MARLDAVKGTTFGLHGRMRDMTFRKTKIGIIAAEYNKPAYNKNKANTSTAKAFGEVGRLGADMKELIEVGFAKLKGNTFNVVSQFVKHNFANCQVTPLGKAMVSYSDVVVSMGAGKRFEGIIAEINANNKLEITWSVADMADADAKTKCYFGVVCPTAERNLEAIVKFSLGDVLMPTGTALIPVSSRWGGKKIYVYGFTRNDKGVVSDSQFLGEITV